MKLLICTIKIKIWTDLEQKQWVKFQMLSLLHAGKTRRWMSNGISTWLAFRPALAKMSGKRAASSKAQRIGCTNSEADLLGKMGELDIPKHPSKTKLCILNKTKQKDKFIAGFWPGGWTLNSTEAMSSEWLTD